MEPRTLHIHEVLFATRPRNGEYYSIAIDGRGGSGKSVLATHLSKLLPDLILINGDDYFEPLKSETVWGAFNEERFNHDVIQPLRRGSRFVYRPYDWHAEPHITEREISVDGGLCLERCFSFSLNLEWDLKLWVETPRTLCLERGIAREHMPKDRVLAAWHDVWQPREDRYIRDQRPREIADFILDGTRPFEEQIRPTLDKLGGEHAT